jgi:FMN phosphatase YigB (HAD superfamily)
MKVKAVLFDFGDTLVKTKKGIYLELLKSLHESLISNSISLPFEELKKASLAVLQ